MRSAIQGHVAMLDNETKENIAAARERLFGRLRNRIADLDVRVDHIAQTGATRAARKDSSRTSWQA